MINIQVEEPYGPEIDITGLEKAVAATLAFEGTNPAAGVSVVIDSDEQLQRLNHTFLGIDAPTDVLSFPSDEYDPDDKEQYLGDIVISFARAAAQAEAARHPVMNEIQLLVVHGTLHLLGHDHAEAAEKSRMWVAQAEILNRMGVQINQLPE